MPKDSIQTLDARLETLHQITTLELAVAGRPPHHDQDKVVSACPWSIVQYNLELNEK